MARQPGSIDFSHPKYKYKYACFTCRKMFKKHPWTKEDKCPQCGEPLYFTGLYFKPPKSSDLETWTVVEKLIKTGILYSEGSHNSLPCPRPTRLRDLDKFIANYRVNKKALFNQGVEAAIHILSKYCSEDNLEMYAQQSLESLMHDYARYVEIDFASTLNTMIEGARRLMQEKDTQATDI